MEKKPKHELRLLMAMLIFGSIGVFVKNINLPSAAIVWWRTIIGSGFLALLFFLTKQPLKIQAIKNNLLLLIAAGIFLGGGWALLFASYHLTTVSIGTLLHYTAPALVFILSPLLFQEKMTSHKVVGIVAAILGMIIINGTGAGGSNFTLGVICALASALFYALVMILNKYLRGLSGLESTFVQLLVAMVVMATYTGITTGRLVHIPRGYEVLLMATVGILHTGIGCYIYFSSMQELPGQTIAIMSYIDPASTLFFSALFLQERLTGFQILGALLILGGTAFSQLAKPKERVKTPVGMD
ncbi:MAG: EamA family transporter [Firmicutes bacterium]|nr:EamA family transporter [Bacillota bacterium]